MEIWPSREWAEWLYNAANIALVASLGIGLAATVLLAWMTSVKERYAAVDVAAAQAHASEANARAAEANARAVEAQLALEAFKAPRRLALPQQKNIAEALRRFSGTPFDMAVPFGDDEALQLAEMIEASLKSAGWSQIEWADKNPSSVKLQRPYAESLGNVSIDGVVVEIDPAGAFTLLEPARALATALSSEGIASRVWENTYAVTAANSHAIHVLVGNKP
jgi:hypothetical protein